MRKISFDKIRKEIESLCLSAAFDLPDDVENAIRKALKSENTERGRAFLKQYLENAELARNERLPICQDTGVAVFFVELGQDAAIEGGLLADAISSGVNDGYKAGFLRMSIVSDPLFERKNTKTNTPPVIHLKLVPGDKLKIILAPKGGGSENMSSLAMLKPSDGRKGVVDFAVNTVIKAGGNPCPPTIVGIGIGGNFEMAALLAKTALLRNVGIPNPDSHYAELEEEILQKINSSGVGPQGLGGSVTSFAVHIEIMPCHIASLPVAVNLNCHAARHKEIII
ncbi:MAG: fumarate hydratase [Lentisphaerae bacterium GWF2_45_14]|nr:MAG: fumarate hydratase [Lentisphaerae bacterium GWF2_45_14]